VALKEDDLIHMLLKIPGTVIKI